MVRKWSYLTPINTKFIDLADTHTLAVYSFKVFKTTTRFKKYSSGLTKFVRKTIAKRKHKTNWLTFSYILQRWIFFYLKNKQFVRYYQSVGMFKFSSYSISINFFQKQNELFPIQSGISLASCSKNILKSFLIRSPSYFISPITNHPSTLMLSQDISELSKNPELNPGLLVYDNILYPHNYSLTKIGSCKSLFRKLKHNFFTTTLKISLIIYRILIKLMLFTIKKLY